MSAVRALVLALALLTGAPAAAATVQELVFEAHLLADLREPQTLHYRYERRGTLFPEAHVSEVSMEVREVSADGDKLVHFDMFEGADRRQFGPMEARAQNPLLIVFLQRDVMQMARLTGGSSDYFRNQVREAFVKPAEVERLEIPFDGAVLPAVRVSITPFVDDPEIARFAQFRHKRYEFTVAAGLPGGLYEIAALTPKGDTKETLLEERITYAGRAPEGDQNR
jgi:hypothetical protein